MSTSENIIYESIPMDTLRQHIENYNDEFVEYPDDDITKFDDGGWLDEDFTNYQPIKPKPRTKLSPEADEFFKRLVELHDEHVEQIARLLENNNNRLIDRIGFLLNPIMCRINMLDARLIEMHRMSSSQTFSRLSD